MMHFSEITWELFELLPSVTILYHVFAVFAIHYLHEWRQQINLLFVHYHDTLTPNGTDQPVNGAACYLRSA